MTDDKHAGSLRVTARYSRRITDAGFCISHTEATAPGSHSEPIKA